MMRDFYWRRSGWRWVVSTVEQTDGPPWGDETILFTTWRKSTAARICALLFETYLQGQDMQRARSAVGSPVLSRE